MTSTSDPTPPASSLGFTSEPVNKNQFIRHELKAPITAIKGYLSMLQEGDYGEMNLSQEQKEVFIKISNDLEALTEKINTLLADGK